jgi:uncharacterized protein DUF4234
MKQRSIGICILLTIVTFGIYGLVWIVKTKGEMVNMGADIPTAWLIIIPIVNIWWLWKWCQGVERVTNGKLSAPVALLIWIFLNQLFGIGLAIIQDAFNKAPAQLPQARVA